MSVLKCKMCGGDITISEDKTIGICDCCGTTITFPKISDEQKLDAFNRGNYFRRLGEFDKALQVYEHIISEEPQNAEAHWCCALCRFGIEYVEDPATMEYIPTCHRASFDSFTEDIDYKAAVENADGITRKQYQKDAMKIADVQRRILATSQNEEPFDVFICYKETDDATGERTKDSIDAQEIYYQLTDEGYRVFFSRITLEDKAGTEYEPYIFAALNSAKVMIVIGSKTEYFNAVWVKNEWSRYIAIMRRDRSKVLLPCYKDINPYDLPEQLSVLQSYDMSKIGFIQDLIRGIKKITASDSPKTVVKETVVNNIQSSVNIAPLLKRAFMFLEDGNWEDADAYCERVLDLDPECAEAYLGKLMAELEVRKKENLKDCAEPFDKNTNCINASKFDSELSDILNGYNDLIKEKLNQAEEDEAYKKATSLMEKYSFSEQRIDNLNQAIKLFESIPGRRDSENKIEECRKLIEKAEKELDENRKNFKKWMSITAIASILVIIFTVVFFMSSDNKSSAAVTKTTLSKSVDDNLSFVVEEENTSATEETKGTVIATNATVRNIRFYVSTKSSSLNVRSQPDSSSSKVASLDQYTGVYKVKDEGEWSYIVYTYDSYGWVKSEYISPLPDVAEDYYYLNDGSDYTFSDGCDFGIGFLFEYPHINKSEADKMMSDFGKKLKNEGDTTHKDFVYLGSTGSGSDAYLSYVESGISEREDGTKYHKRYDVDINYKTVYYNDGCSRFAVYYNGHTEKEMADKAREAVIAKYPKNTGCDLYVYGFVPSDHETGIIYVFNDSSDVVYHLDYNYNIVDTGKYSEGKDRDYYWEYAWSSNDGLPNDYR